MGDKFSKLNKVIAELNLVAAKLANNDPTSELKALLDQAALDLAAATQAIGGVGKGEGEDNG